MRERLVGGVGADAVEHVVVADGRHFDEVPVLDHPREVRLVVRDRIVLLLPGRHLGGQEAPRVGVVPQLGGDLDARGASDGLAALLFDELGGGAPRVHLRGGDCGRGSGRRRGRHLLGALAAMPRV